MKLALPFYLVVILASALYGVHSVSTRYCRAAALLFKKKNIYIYNLFIYLTVLCLS